MHSTKCLLHTEALVSQTITVVWGQWCGVSGVGVSGAGVSGVVWGHTNSKRICTLLGYSIR